MHKKDTFDKFAITLIIAVILGVIILVGLIVIIAHRYQTKAPSAMTFNKSVEHMDKGSTGYVNKGLSNE